jgi:hypothetical protein
MPQVFHHRLSRGLGPSHDESSKRRGIMEDCPVTVNWPQRTAQARSPQSRPTISQEVQATIGEQLRATYDDLQAESLPDRLIDLLRQMDKPS